MEYTVTDVTWVNAPKKKEGDPNTLQVTVNVTTGIVGQPYVGFQNVDTIVVEFADTLTGVQIEQSVIAQCAAFSANKYPNT